MKPKLTVKDAKLLKARLIGEQGGICPISNLPLAVPCLDHNHVTGLVRGVLGRAANSWEGKCFNAFVRTGLRNQGADYLDCLQGLIAYLSKKPYDFIHPAHKTPEEKKELRAKRAKAKRTKAKRNKAKREKRNTKTISTKTKGKKCHGT